MPDILTAHYRSDDTIRSRRVSDIVLTDTLDVPAPPASLLVDWQRESSSRLGLQPGDVEVMPLARTRFRWPELGHCVQAVSNWLHTLGLRISTDMALMACRGARYHHDALQYGHAAFCNLFLSDDKGLDLHFPSTGHRIPLIRGTAVIFDTGRPHGVIRRGSSGFSEADFAPDQDFIQIFLTWELPIEDVQMAKALDVTFTLPTSTQRGEAQLQVNGVPATVCPESGQWQWSERS
jgi:hypothetical protein